MKLHAKEEHPYPYCLYSPEQNRQYTHEKNKNGRQGKKFTFRFRCNNLCDEHQHPTLEQIAYLMDMRYVEWLDESRGIAAYRLPDEGPVYTSEKHGMYAPGMYVQTGNVATPKKHLKPQQSIGTVEHSMIPAGWEPIADWPLIRKKGNRERKQSIRTCVTQRFTMPSMQLATGMVHLARAPYVGNADLCNVPFLSGDACPRGLGVHFCAEQPGHLGPCRCICSEERKGKHSPFRSLRRVGQGWRIDLDGVSVTLKASQALRRIAAIITEYRTYGKANPITVEYGPIAHNHTEIEELAGENGDAASDSSEDREDCEEPEDVRDWGFQNTLGWHIPSDCDDAIFKKLPPGFRKCHGMWFRGAPRNGLQLWLSEADRLIVEAQKLEEQRDFRNAAQTRHMANILRCGVENNSNRGKSYSFKDDFYRASKKIRESITELQRQLAASDDQAHKEVGEYIKNFVRPRGILADSKSTWFIYDGQKQLLFTPQTDHRLHVAKDWHSKAARLSAREIQNYSFVHTLSPNSHDETMFDHYEAWESPWCGPKPYAPWPFDVWMRQRRHSGEENPIQSARPKKERKSPTIINALDYILRISYAWPGFPPILEPKPPRAAYYHPEKTRAEVAKLARASIMGELNNIANAMRRTALVAALEDISVLPASSNWPKQNRRAALIEWCNANAKKLEIHQRKPFFYHCTPENFGKPTSKISVSIRSEKERDSGKENGMRHLKPRKPETIGGNATAGVPTVPLHEWTIVTKQQANTALDDGAMVWFRPPGFETADVAMVRTSKLSDSIYSVERIPDVIGVVVRDRLGVSCPEPPATIF